MTGERVQHFINRRLGSSVKNFLSLLCFDLYVGDVQLPLIYFVSTKPLQRMTARLTQLKAWHLLKGTKNGIHFPIKGLTCSHFAIPSIHARTFSHSSPAALNSNYSHLNKCQNASHTTSKQSSDQHNRNQPEAVKISTLAFWSSPHHWKRATVNTTRCLIGCTLGDFSALWFLQANFPDMGMGSIMAISSSPRLLNPTPFPFPPPKLTPH